MKTRTLLTIAVIGIAPLLNGCSNPENERAAKQQQALKEFNEDVRAIREKQRQKLGMPPYEEKR